ncbi:MAG: 23S rRNA (adenine(2503)-C(2))-methyltransferase RlmN [bacterium]|nr:23S rRNA (adenine(2503)-C(2))-methyltransferase RlmN [bacterium]
MSINPANIASSYTLPTLIGMDRSGLAEFFSEQAQPTYRVEQVYKWLYSRGVRDPRLFSDMPKAFRQWLYENTAPSNLSIAYRTESQISGVIKYLFLLRDERTIEGVWIPDKERATLCVSSQVGCALGCTFCATGTMGLIRQLTTGEIIEQALTVRYSESRPLTHVVFMGMGEPMHNYDAVKRAVRILNDPAGVALAKRHITVSTAGWVPGIYQMIEDKLPCRLAISMGSPDDVRREAMMPVTKKYSLDELFVAMKAWADATGNRVTIEYTLLEGVNDSIADARLLIKRLHGIPAKINVLTYNPGPDAPFRRPSIEQIDRFTAELHERYPGAVTRRLSRGDEIGAACGQLVILEQQKRKNTSVEA